MIDTNHKKFLPKEKAKQILSILEIEHPSEIDIDLIAYKRGAMVISDKIIGAEARLSRTKDKGIITVSNEIPEPGRIRFNIAHELGHFELHKNEETLTICTDEDLNQWYQNQFHLEQSANIFAAELLLPEYLFKPLVKNKKPSFAEITKLAKIFKTSIMATATKFIEHTDEVCCLFISKDKKLKRFGPSKDFSCKVKLPGENLSQDSEAHRFFKNGYVDIARPTQISADAWINDPKVNPNSLIWEDTFAMNNYNTVLSLIWVKDSIEKNDYSNEGLLRDLDPESDLSPGGRTRGFY
jgi:Zn-dependent peptidase ImmA (M78 family)